MVLFPVFDIFLFVLNFSRDLLFLFAPCRRSRVWKWSGDTLNTPLVSLWKQGFLLFIAEHMKELVLIKEAF